MMKKCIQDAKNNVMILCICVEFVLLNSVCGDIYQHHKVDTFLKQTNHAAMWAVDAEELNSYIL